MVTFLGKQYPDWAAARASLVTNDPAPSAVAVAELEPEPEPEPEPVASAAPTRTEAAPPDRRVSLAEKYRPRCLADVAGQPDAVAALRAFVDAPYSAAFVLARRIWRTETGGEIPGDVLGKVMLRATTGGRLSFRRVVQSLVPLLAAKGR